MFVDPNDAQACASVPFSSRNSICACLEVQCKDACLMMCRR
jgi:hypothetical protein